jgi:predicted alpha-1,2-mannosidase
MSKLVNKLLVSIGLVVLFFACQNQANDDKDFTEFVNPFIGTEGTGHTFPGPCLPFGMVQPGPDNRDQGWDYTSGYQYRDSTIIGFSQTRANGTGISEFGDVLLQPVTDSRTEKFGEGYNKRTERATPGYYSVTLRNQVKVELSASERVAFHKYTYPNNKAKLLVDLQHGLRFLTDSLVLESDVRLSNQNSISGFCHTKNWVDRKYFFFIQFDQPFVTNSELVKKPKEKAPKYILEFELKDKVLKTKVALSTVSVEGAIANLKTEIPEWDFDRTVTQAKQKWNEYLSRIEIEADQKQKEIFYSCMYRLFIQPSNRRCRPPSGK